MNNIIKRICVVFLTVCLIFSQQTFMAFAESNESATEGQDGQAVEQQLEDQQQNDAAVPEEGDTEQGDISKGDTEQGDTEKSEPAEVEKETPKEAEKSDVQDTEKAEQPKKEAGMPAGSESASTSDMDVSVSWDKNIFPEGVSMKVRKASKKEAMDAAQDVVDKDKEVVDAIAVDITFYAEGKEVQPKDSDGVKVTLKAKRAIKGETHQVVHIDEKGNAEHVAKAGEKKATFDSVGFSVYAIVGTDGKTADEEEVRRTYIFYGPNDNNPDYDHTTGVKEISRQIVKNGDVLVEPGTPTLNNQPDSYFAGWYAEGSDTRMTFGGVVNDIPATAGSQDETVKVYAKYVTKYVAVFRDDTDDTGDIEHEIVGVAGDEISLNVEIPGIEEKGKRLTGWKLKETGTTYGLDGTYTFNSTDKDVEFEPIFQTVRKIQFNANHEDASFTPPAYVQVGEKIPAVEDPKNTGYTFTGWYLDEECTHEFELDNDTVPAGDEPLQLYAGWDPQQVDFQVYVWGEVMDSNGDPIPEGGDGRYAVKAEWTSKIEAGHRFTVEEVKQEYQSGISNPDNLIDSSFASDRNYYTPTFDTQQIGDGLVVKGDGSTIINLYFDLKEFTFTFHPASASNKWRVTDILHTEDGQSVGVGGGNTYTFKAKYGQDITDLWPSFTYTKSRTESPDFYSKYPVFGWRISPTSSGTDTQPPLGTGNFITHRHNFTTDVVYKVDGVPQETTNFWPHGANNNTSTTLHAYYMEPVKEGVDYDSSLKRRSRNGIDYVEMPEYTEHFTYSSTTYNAQKTIKGYSDIGWERESSGSATRYFYYLPKEYEIIFHNYNHESSVTGVEYKSDISEYAGRTPNREETGLPDYYTFQGWYTDRQYQNEFNFEGATMPANNLVLYAYWKANDVTVTFDANGGKFDNDETTTSVEVPANSLVEPPNPPTREGYFFVGWGVQGNPFDTVDFTQRRFSENTTLEAHWTTTRDKYNIEYTDDIEGHDVPVDTNKYDYGSEIILKKSPSSGKSHQFHGYYIKGYDPESGKYMPGDTFIINNPDMDPNGDGVIEIAAYHGNTEDEEQLKGIKITYHSNYPDGTTNTTVEQPDNGEDLERNETVAAKGTDTFSRPGYVLTAWNTKADGSGTQFEPGQEIFADKIGTNDLYGVWAEAPDVEYKVEHYKQDLDDPTKYTKVEADTETLIGTTGDSVTATPKDYTGFTFDEDKTGSQDEGTILSDGSLVLKVYYSRNTYKLTYKYVGVTPADAQLPSPNPVENLKYEQEVPVATTPYKEGDSFNGYTFNGWVKEREDLVMQDGKVIMPARDVILDGSWTPNSDTKYKVEFYFQNVNNDEYTRRDSETKILTGTTGTNVTAAAETFEGFTFNPDAEGTKRTGTIIGYEDEDDMLVLKLYYDRNK